MTDLLDEGKLGGSVADVYPLSPIQEGLAFELEYRAGTGIYLEQLVITLRGPVQGDLVEAAWQTMVARHPILRTTFHQLRSRSVQVVHRRGKLPLERFDWRELSEDDRDKRLRDWMLRERMAGFDHERLPLMRTALIRTGAQDWILFWRFSHQLMDGWSFGLGLAEFGHCYRALHVGLDPADCLPPAPAYRDYVAWWQLQDAGDDRLFWRRELADLRPPRTLIIAPEPLTHGEPTHDAVEVDLGARADRVRDFCRAHSLTLNTVIQGAWMLLLSEYFDTDDVICGATIAHRPTDLPRAQEILGPMITTVPVRERIIAGRVATAWLADFQRHLVEVRDHLRVPLANLSAHAPDPQRPLLQSSVSFENVPLPELPWSDIGIELVGTKYDGRPHFPITLVIMPGDEIPLRCVYDRGHFGRAVARRFCDQLVSLMEHMIGRMGVTLGELRVGAAISPVIDTKLITGEPQSLTHTIAEHAIRSPNKTALVYGEQRVSYGELVEAAHQGSIALVRRGCRSGDRVAICLPPGLDYVLSVLSVMGCGAAYVPLDPYGPRGRASVIVADCATRIVITDGARLDQFADSEVLDVAVLKEPVPGPVLEPPRAEDFAYVLYTSGTTGVPKGVPTTHAQIQSLIAAGRIVFGLSDTDVITVGHSCAFDFSVLELFSALGCGATAVVVPPGTLREPVELLELVRSKDITLLCLTPGVFDAFTAVAIESGSPPKALRAVLLGGDRLTVPVVRRWAERFGLDTPRLFNLYGVTEAAVISSWHRVDADDLTEGGDIPIGVPLPNQQLRVLDRAGRSVASGIPGTLTVSGPGVAAGYVNGTQWRFGGGGYCTGDRVVLGERGLTFLGRDDDQLSLRGIRVELGEIEAALLDCAAVESATVLTTPRGVVAFVTGGAPAASELADRLPAYMVPRRVVTLEKVPLTVNGKVDVCALTELMVDEGSGETGDGTPNSPVEIALVEELRLLLEDPSLDATSDLVSAGLHSLQAMRLTSRMRMEHDFELSVADVLAATTVRQVAKVVVG